jgi:hypothetical protein
MTMMNLEAVRFVHNAQDGCQFSYNSGCYMEPSQQLHFVSACTLATTGYIFTVKVIFDARRLDGYL